MKKAFIQWLIIILVFSATWIALSQIDWIKILRVKEITYKTEQKLGSLVWGVFKSMEDENNNKYALSTLDSIVTHICIANEIDRDKFKIHILNKDEVNAFALPGGHIVLYSGLILNSDNQDELTGVICHEIAHIELNHVMKKLMKEIGISTLIGLTTSSSGLGPIKEVARVLSSSAFDRNMEREADIKAVDYLINSGVNPEPFANFFHKLSEVDKYYKYPAWIGSHPDLNERVGYVLEYSKGRLNNFQSILSNKTWQKLLEELSN